MVTFLQSHLHNVRTWGLRLSYHYSIVVFVGGFGNKHVSTFGKERKDSATLQNMFVCMKEKLRTKTSRTSAEISRDPIKSWDGFLFLDMSSSNSFLSIAHRVSSIKNFQHVWLNVYVMMVHVAFNARLKNCTPKFI